MQGYDFFMLAILIGAVCWGAWKGFVWQVASIASLVLSYFVSLTFRAPLANVINAAPPWNIFLAMLALFLGTSLVVWIGFNFISDLVERVRLKEFDRQLGAMFGFVKGVALCVIVTLFAVTLLDESRRQQICNSRSGYYIALILVQSEALMPRELKQVLAPYLPQGTQQAQPYPSLPQNQQGYAPEGQQWTNQQQPPYNPQNGYQPNAGYQPNNNYAPNDAYAPPGGYDPRMSNQGYNSSNYPPR